MKLLQILNEIEVINTMSYRVKVGDKTIVVAPGDLGEMNWNEATEACKKIGPGWRLPTSHLLKAMYRQLHVEGKGNFKDDWYWSSSQYDSGHAWGVNFSSGNVGYSGRGNSFLVRPVRSLDSTI